MRCLLCHEQMMVKPTWRRIFLQEEGELVCERCESGFEVLGGEQCRTCARVLDQKWRSQRDSELCLDCERWQQHPTASQLLKRNLSLYAYNERMKDCLSLYKFQGDAEIGRYFSMKMKRAYQSHFQAYSPVLMPLSEDRLKARGFNQVEQMTSEWLAPIVTLGRTTGEQQSKKNRSTRIQQVTHSPFFVEKGQNSIKALQKVVLIDDVYTTGTTVRQAAKTLIEQGATHVESFTLCR
jgi:competence protein ComFC